MTSEYVIEDGCVTIEDKMVRAKLDLYAVLLKKDDELLETNELIIKVALSRDKDILDIFDMID